MGPAHHNEQYYNFSADPSQALEKLMDQFGTVVLRTAYFYLRDRHLAEDISQEVFIRVYRNWKKFRGESSIKTWLIKITINLCYDKLRKKATKEVPHDLSQIEIQLPFNLEKEVLKRIESTELLKYVLKLPSHYQEVIYLYYYLDFNTVEIANALDKPEGTVRTQLTRARKLLAEQVSKGGQDHE